MWRQRQSLLEWKMEAPSTADDKEEGEYYAAVSTPTKGGRMQTKYVCCHCYSDGELATDAYIDEKRKDRGGKKYLPICKACVNDGAQLVWSRRKKTTQMQKGNARELRDQM